MINFICAQNNLVPSTTERVRWFDKDADFELARINWRASGFDLSYAIWSKAHEYGYQYAGIVDGGKIISLAAAWHFSEKCWEVAAVGTLENYRRRGHAKSVMTFITTYIHESGKLATCTTNEDNTAMIATAESVGFQRIPASEVWWIYPQLPDL